MAKSIVLIGGSTGIGLSLTQMLSQEEVHVFSRTQGALDTSKIASFTTLDILNDELKDDMLPEVIDGLVYLPGSIVLKPFRSLSADQFRKDYEINVVGAVKAIQACMKGMKKASGTPSIVLFSTVAVGQGMPFHASIAAAKAAVEGLVRSTAAEFSPNIRVNAIAPSLTDTPLAANLLSNDDRREAGNQRHPLKRFGQPKDIASAAKFLLSDDSDWITGQVLHVDGGLSVLRV